MVYYIDIDGTICHYKDEGLDYSKAIPDIDRIEKVNNLYEEGNVVIYWTARGSNTGIDWTELTTRQLNDWGAKYTKVRFGKPHYDLFICDKAINSEKFFKDERL